MVVASSSVPRHQPYLLVGTSADTGDTIAEARHRTVQVMLDSRGSLPAESTWTALTTRLTRVPARNLIGVT